MKVLFSIVIFLASFCSWAQQQEKHPETQNDQPPALIDISVDYENISIRAVPLIDKKLIANTIGKTPEETDKAKILL